LLKKKRRRGRRVCGECNKYGHNTRTCPVLHPERAKAARKRGVRKCGVCGRLGHNSRTCKKAN
jgi:hypothetical protein